MAILSRYRSLSLYYKRWSSDNDLAERQGLVCTSSIEIRDHTLFFLRGWGTKSQLRYALCYLMVCHILLVLKIFSLDV